MPKGYTRIEQGVYRTPERNYWVRATACHPRSGHRINRSATLPKGATLREARVKLAELRDEIERVTIDDAPTGRCKRLTLADCAERWTGAQRGRVRPGTARLYTDVLGQHILPAPIGPDGTPFGELYIDQITRSDIDGWCRWAERHTQEDGRLYAKATVEGWWRVLCAFVRDTAAELELSDPIQRVKAPRLVGRPKRREQRTLKRSQLAALVRAVEAPRRAEVYLLAYTGMRPGELYALEWGDIDWDAGCIRLRRAHLRGHVDATKTDAPRDLGMTEGIARVLREHQQMSVRVDDEGVGLPMALIEHLAREKYVTNKVVRRLLGFGEMKARLALRAWTSAGLLRRCGPETRPRYLMGDARADRAALRRAPSDPLVFPSRVGTHRTSSSLDGPLELARQRVGVDFKVTAQVLRRTFNTLMVRAGVDRIVLRAQMGHCSEEMTARYAGIPLEAKRDAVALIEDEGED